MNYCPMCLADPKAPHPPGAEAILCDDCKAYLARANAAINKGEVEPVAVLLVTEDEEGEVIVKEMR